jgi:hypothetical protein
MRFRLAAPPIIAAMLALWAGPAIAWGSAGHRITAEIAQDHVSGHTRAHVARILQSDGQGDGLVEASTWADEQRSNPAPFWQETAPPWHYVTLPPGQRAQDLVHPPEGDAASALAAFTATLRNPAASAEDRAVALRFIVHIVGDLHMPLHVGRPGDRGGNDVRVLWFGDAQNLHSVWDSGLIARRQLGVREYADRLKAGMSAADVEQWWDPRPETWMDESAALRERIYPPTNAEAGLGTRESPVRLSWQYASDWIPAAELRLQQAGIRLAAYLEWVFAAGD